MKHIILSFLFCEFLAYLAAGYTPIATEVYFVMGVVGILVGAAMADMEKGST